MKVDPLDRNMVDSDLGVVNAARCSFDKESQWEYVRSEKGSYYATNDDPLAQYKKIRKLSDKDAKLIQYLATHNHWTPFAHAQECFKLRISLEDNYKFFIESNLSGFEFKEIAGQLYIRGSLYAWLTNHYNLPFEISGDLLVYLNNKYPVTTKTLLLGDNPLDQFSQEKFYGTYITPIQEPLYNFLKPYTLRITCPIFVKRQLETHRRNFVMTDIEDFSQNEVSRRYVDTPPEVYHPQQWRLQAKDKKQGSSEEVIGGIEKYLIDGNYEQNVRNAVLYYQSMNERNISHEQSRMILPLSTYTTFWWTGSLKSWERMFTLRLDSHAQSETREIAQMCYEVINDN